MAATDTPILEPETAIDAAAERAARQCRILGELAEIGVRLALILERQAEAQTPPQTDVAETARAAEPAAEPFRGDLGLAFDRLTRAVRLTLMLQTRIEDGEVGR